MSDKSPIGEYWRRDLLSKFLADDRVADWHLRRAYGAERQGARDAAKKIVCRLRSGRRLRDFVVADTEDGEQLVEVANPLDVILFEFFSHFGYHVGCEALTQALHHYTAGRPGKPSPAITRVRRALKPYMPSRGNARGKAKVSPDRLERRDALWLLLSDRMTANGTKPMAAYRAIAHAEGLGVHRVKTRVAQLRNAQKATAALIEKDVEW